MDVSNLVTTVVFGCNTDVFQYANIHKALLPGNTHRTMDKADAVSPETVSG